MIRAFVNFLLGLRKIFQNLFGKVFSRFRDDKTGKIKGINPKTLRNIVMVAAGVFFLGILLLQIFGSQTQLPGGLEDFRKEMSPKLGVGEQEQNYKSVFGDDPLSQLNNLKTDPLAGLKGVGNDSSNNGNTGNVETTADGTPLPSVSDCLDLIDKLKNGTILSAEEQAVANVCMEKNIAQLSAEELAAVKQLMRTDLSQEERDAIRAKLSGDLDPDSTKGKAVDALIEAARKGDLAAMQDARNALAALEAKNQELAEALLKKIDEEPLSDREKGLIQAFESKINDTSKTANDPSQGSNREQVVTNLSKDVAEREAQMKALQDELARAQAEAAKAGEKIAKGLALSKAEQDAIRKLTELQARQEALAQLQKERLAALSKNFNALNATMTQAALTIRQSVPSGITVEIEETIKDCDKYKALPIKTVKRGKGKGGKVASNNKEVWLTTDGEALTPDRIRLIQLMRNKKAQQDKTIADITNPLGKQNGKGQDLGEKLDVAQVFGEEGANVEIGALTVFADKSLKTFNLTPDMKIPAILDSEILISDKGSNQMVRVRVIDDIHNPETGQIVIPKGSIVIGQTSGFDADTGLMDLSFDKVTVGSGKILPVKFSIGSADGTMGLKGQVRDTRGKFLLGAFITSFTAGALNWFSQQVIQTYITETDAGNALLGASLQGGSDVMNRIAELYAGDLQNAAKIFYVPKKIPVVLFPQ